MAKKMISFITKELMIVIVLLLCAILFLNISTLITMNKIEKGYSVLEGYASAIVRSGSMEPALSKHDLIIIKAKSDYREGDIVTFVSNNGSLVTHRIISLSENEIITQGDANNVADSEIDPQMILGEVILILPGIGLFATFLSTPIGIIYIIAIPIFIIIITHLIRKISEEKETVT